MVKPGRAAGWIFPLMTAALFLLPAAALLVSSLTGENGIFSLENYSLVALKPRTIRAFELGLRLCAVAAAVSVAVSAMAAAALVRYPIPESAALRSAIRLLGGLPYSTLVIPLYFVLFNLKMLDSVSVTVLFFATANIPANTMILADFLEQIPPEQEEAARMDGATLGAIAGKLLLPELFPALTGALVGTFINSWGNFIVPFILLSSSEKLPAALALFQAFSTGSSGQYGYLSAWAILYFLPVIVLYSAVRFGLNRLVLLRSIRK